MPTAAQIDFAETRRLAAQMVLTGEKILALLEVQNPLPGMKNGTDSNLKFTIIRRLVSAKFGFTGDDILAMDRRAHVAWARMVAMFLCKELTNCSEQQIEDHFQRTHGCLDNAMHTVQRRCSTPDRDGRRCAAAVIELRKQIQEAFSENPQT